MLHRLTSISTGQRRTLLCASALSIIYTAIVCWHGIPALRHDWTWPGNNQAFLDVIVGSTSGWNTAGMGAPAAYPGAYIVGTCIGLVGLLFGPFPTLVIFVAGIAATITIGARKLSMALGAPSILICALETFALFNPWVYNKTVAGHLYMLLAYGALCLLLAELLSPIVRQRKAALLLILILPQVQFYVIALVIVTVFALLRRAPLLWLSAIVIWSPVWLGILLDRGNLLKTPYTLAWESAQSVVPSKAPILMGYFTQYASHVTWIQIGALWIMTACVAIAIALTTRRALAIVSAVLTIALIILSTGTRGVLGPLYSSFVLRLPESGLFRELYDLLGFVAIGYLIILACMTRVRALSAITLLASITVASSWLTYPPSNYWVPLGTIPKTRVNTAPNTRFAMFPPYQPMRFNGNGSGVDPEMYARSGNVTPLNDYLARYPANMALSAYAATGSPSDLQALSVSLIVERPWFQTNLNQMRYQVSGTLRLRQVRQPLQHYIMPLPEVTFQDMPLIASLANKLGAGNIFFADAGAVSSALAPPEWEHFPRFMPAKASNSLVDVAKGWADAQFLFGAMPQIGEGLGGAATTSDRASLAVLPGLKTLVDVRGALVSETGRIATKSTNGYQWITMPNTRSVRCEGRCVVVGQVRLDAVPPLNPAPRRYVAASFSVLTPWLVRVSVPAHRLPALRYNVAYDPNWVAYSKGHPATHVRLDATVNGWLLSQDNKAYVVYLYHRVALIQAIAECVSIVLVLVLAASLALPNGMHRSRKDGYLE